MADLLLELRQQLLRLAQSQTQIGDIAEIVGAVDFHDVQGPPLAFGADLHQPYDPRHEFPQVKDRPENARVARRPQNLRQSPSYWHKLLNQKGSGNPAGLGLEPRL